MENIIISIIYGITLGFALSVDAFMLSLIYGSTFKRKMESIITSIIVSSFHFSILLIGYYITLIFFTSLNLYDYFEDKVQFFSFLILALLSIMMLYKNDNKIINTKRNIFSKCLFALSVSLDSFLAGIALTSIKHIIIFITAICISIISFIITLFALLLGHKTKEKLLNKNFEFYASIILLILAIITLFI